jgi:hypothetical protein
MYIPFVGNILVENVFISNEANLLIIENGLFKLELDKPFQTANNEDSIILTKENMEIKIWR